MKVTTYVSPSLNANSNSRPLAFGIQHLSPDASDSAIQVQHFIPLASAGNLPNGWDGVGGWVANSIVSVNTTFSNVSPGKHTLKLWMIEPAVVLQKFVVGDWVSFFTLSIYFIIITSLSSLLTLTYTYRYRERSSKLLRSPRERYHLLIFT